MKAVITVEMDNAAFEDRNGEELARILRECASIAEDSIMQPGDKEIMPLDINGNKIGSFEVVE